MAESSMASPEQPATSSRPKRPAPMTRQSSSQSHISQSPSEKGHHRPQQHKVTHRHVAGGRMQRTLSTGKNLAKFPKATQHTQAQATEEGGRHHRRSQSGTSISAPSSPRPGFKRNASSGAIMRHNPNAHVGLRKNHSSGHLVGKAKGGKSSKDLAQAKGKLGNPSRSRQASPEERPIVHFDVGNNDNDEDEEEGGWTEESASQSPNTTRSNTRSNSVAAEAQRVVDDATESNTRANAGDVSPGPAVEQANANPTYTLPERSRPTQQTTRAASSNHSRPPDADLITSRLLQRSASHTVVAPQPSSVSATVQSNERSGHQLSTSVSTLVDTPGRDLVSRFMDGDGSAGTPHDGNYMPGRRASQARQEGELDKSKRNQSMPNFNAAGSSEAEAETEADTPTRPQSVRSGATTPNAFPSHSNRTQQKLMLQRAASAIEPHAPVPAILRTGGPSFHNIGLSYPGEGRIDPRLQQQFNHVSIEYKVVQRYRNPLAGSIVRIQQMPGMLRKLRASKPGSAGANGGSSLGISALSSSLGENGEMDGAGGRSRASSEVDREDAPRNEAEELCRRMWDSAEIVGGD
jgi:hypothetical protein